MVTDRQPDGGPLGIAAALFEQFEDTVLSVLGDAFVVVRGREDDLGTGPSMRAIRYARERKKQEVALREQTERIRFFNSVLCHDVGNGMDVIRRKAQVLDSGLDGEQAERAGTTRSWSEDIIDLTGKIRRMLDAVVEGNDLDRSAMDLSTVLRKHIEYVPLIDEAVTIDTDVPDDVRALADDMLPAVLGNVISNAIEHNDADESHVSVRMGETDDAVTVTTADNGPGIPATRKRRYSAGAPPAPRTAGSARTSSRRWPNPMRARQDRRQRPPEDCLHAPVPARHRGLDARRPVSRPHAF